MRIGKTLACVGIGAAALALSYASAADPARPACVPDVPAVHCGAAPTAAFDRAGRLWVAFAHGGRVHVASSGDAGRSFGAARAVNAEPEDIDVNGENRPKIAFGADAQLYVTWTKKLPGGYNGAIRFSRSLDGGATFEPPMTLNDDGLVTGHRFESLHVDAAGHIYVAWLDKRDLAAPGRAQAAMHGAAVYYTVSTDGGTSFAPNRKIADSSCECCRIAVAEGPAGGAAIFWRHVFDGSIRDHAYAAVGPNGVLQPARRVTHDGWRIDACPHHGPAMIPAGASAYHAAWFTAGTERRGLFYGRYSLGSPGPAALEQERQLSAAPSAAHPHLAAARGAVYAAWKEFDGEHTAVRLSVSRDEGATWSPAKTLVQTKGESDHPFLLSRAGEVFLSWHTQTEGLRVVPLAAAEAPSRFGPESLGEIERAHAGEPFLAVVWSIECAPCRRELELLAQLAADEPRLRIVLIATDAVEHAAAVNEVASRYLPAVESWIFADGSAERLRHAVDPEWFGEMPRAYFYAADSSRRGVSGALERTAVLDWLKAAQP